MDDVTVHTLRFAFILFSLDLFFCRVDATVCKIWWNQLARQLSWDISFSTGFVPWIHGYWSISVTLPAPDQRKVKTAWITVRFGPLVRDEVQKIMFEKQQKVKESSDQEYEIMQKPAVSASWGEMNEIPKPQREAKHCSASPSYPTSELTVAGYVHNYPVIFALDNCVITSKVLKPVVLVYQTLALRFAG